MQALIQSRRKRDSGIFFGDVSVLESLDGHTQIVRQQWQAGEESSLFSRLFCAPREIVAVRTWREDEEGVFVVICQSTDHRKARKQTPGWFPSWSKPIRATVTAAGYTFSPLLPQYASGQPSRECLVTLVVQMDLGGGLGADSWLAKALPGAVESARWALLEPMVMSAVLLRNKVEQSKFVVQPYTLDADEDDSMQVAGISRPVHIQSQPKQQQPLEVSPGKDALLKQPTAAPDTPTTPRKRLALPRTTTSIVGSPTTLDSTILRAADATLRAISTPPSGGSSRKTSFRMQHSSDLGAICEETEISFEAARDKVLPSRPSYTPQPRSSEGIPPEEAWAVGGTIDQKYWYDHGSSHLRIRGKNYLQDRIKIPAATAMMKLYAADLLNMDEPMVGVGRCLPSVKCCPEPFAFIMSLIFPNGPVLQHLIMVWTMPLDPNTATIEELLKEYPEDDEGTVTAFFKNLKTQVVQNFFFPFLLIYIYN